MSDPRSDERLSRRSFDALGWNYAGTAARALGQLAIGVVLARLLTPEQFGTVAIGWLMVGVGMLVADMGLGVILIQRRRITDDDVAFCATTQLALGAVLCVGGVAGAGWIAAWFGKPEAASVVRAMSLLFVVQSAGATPLALMRRELDFRAAQLIGIASYLVGYVGFGIPAAVRGCGAWSLVGAQLVQAAVATAIALFKARLPLRLQLRGSRDLAGAGLKVTGTNLVNYALLNADSFAVGRSLGADALGIYGRAMAVVQSPAGALSAGLQGVLLAACSRAQTDLRMMRKAFLASTGAFASLVLPVFLTVASVAPTVVEALYGHAWLAAAPILGALAVSFAIQALASLPGPILGAVGRFETELRIQSLALAVMLPTVAVASTSSSTAVAWSLVAVRVLQLAALTVAVCRQLGSSPRPVLAVLAWPAGIAVGIAGLTHVADRLLGSFSPAARLFADMLVAGAALIACARLFGKAWASASQFGDALPLDRLPRFLRIWLDVEDAGAPAAGSALDGGPGEGASTR